MALPDNSKSPDPTPIMGGPNDWETIARSADFQDLLRAKRRFIIPAMTLSLLYFFALPVLVGWFPELMKKKVGGGVNLAYLFALSQFFMVGLVAGLYLFKAGAWDKAAAALLAKFREK